MQLQNVQSLPPDFFRFRFVDLHTYIIIIIILLLLFGTLGSKDPES